MNRFARVVAIVLSVAAVAVICAVVIDGRSGALEPTASVSSAPPQVTLEPTTPSSPTASPSPTMASPPSSDVDGPKSTIPGATVVITIATHDQINELAIVGGFISGVFEDGAECEFLVTALDTGEVATAESVSMMNVDSSTCGSHEVALPRSDTGKYSVQLTYSNDVGTATSAVVPLEEL